MVVNGGRIIVSGRQLSSRPPKIFILNVGIALGRRSFYYNGQRISKTGN